MRTDNQCVSDAGELRHLGGDVWLAPGEAPVKLSVGGRVHYRFMDRLLIPAPTSELDLDSIVAINRWRERLLENGELPHRALVRRITIAVLTDVRVEAMIELGCGKFPLQPDLGIADYAGVDIDPEAVAHCRANGLDAATSPEAMFSRAFRTNAVAALFVLQFPLADSTIDLLRRTREDCVVVANLPTKDPALVEERLWLLEESDMQAIRVAFGDANDQLLIAGRDVASAKCQTAATTAKRLIDAVALR